MYMFEIIYTHFIRLACYLGDRLTVDDEIRAVLDRGHGPVSQEESLESPQ